MKRITARIDEYEKDGQTKGKYVEVGVILNNSNGEFILLNPTVDLSGVLLKQRLLAQKAGKKVMDAVACSIFDNNQNNQQQAPQQNNKPADSFDDDIPF